MKKTLILGIVALLPCHAYSATWQDVIAKVQSGQAVRIGILGNSIGCGQTANDSTGTVFNTLTMLNSTYAKTFTGGSPPTMLTSFGPTNIPVAGWAQQLYAYLQTKNASSVVINLSGSGWDTGDQLGVYSANSGKPGVTNNAAVFATMSPKPDAVLIPLEVNDWGHAQGLTFFNTNFQTIITTIENAGIVPIVVIESPIYNRPDITGGDNYTANQVSYPADYNYTQAARALAVSNGLGVMDFETPMMALINAQAGTYFGTKMANTGLWQDGAPTCSSGSSNPCPVHPNQAGHNAMAGYAIAWFQQSFTDASSKIPLTRTGGIPLTRTQGISAER